jgi:hypothetical protein
MERLPPNTAPLGKNALGDAARRAATVLDVKAVVIFWLESTGIAVRSQSTHKRLNETVFGHMAGNLICLMGRFWKSYWRCSLRYASPTPWMLREDLVVGSIKLKEQLHGSLECY